MSLIRIISAVALLVLARAEPVFADDHSSQSPELQAVQAAIDDLYEVISGPVGAPRDWERFYNMYTPNAVMGAVSPGPDGQGQAVTFGPEGYIERSGEWLVENGFSEVATRTEITLYGELAYAKSAYEGTNGATGETFLYGVNFITLFKIDGEWKVAAILWRQADENWPVDAAFD